MGLSCSEDRPGENLRQGQIPVGNGQFGQRAPRRAVYQGTECRQPVSPLGGVTPSRTISEPPCPEAGRPTLAKSSLGRPGSPGSDTSSVRIRPVCTTSSQTSQKVGTHGRMGALVQVRRLLWAGMDHSGNAWRRILPKPAAHVQPARRGGPLDGPPELARQLPSGVHSFGWRAGRCATAAYRHWEGRRTGVTERHPGPWVSRVRNASTGAEKAAAAHRQADGPSGGATGAAVPDPAGKGRRTHVRNRLIIAVAVVAAAIAAAGVPS